MPKYTKKSKKSKNYSSCPCNGGQSCIVDRRTLNDYVHEDILFKNSNLPWRKHCYAPYTKDQYLIMKINTNTIKIKMKNENEK